MEKPVSAKIIIVAGARPNFMKVAPIIWELQKRAYTDFALVHTGQHYDYAMSKVFFDELEIPEPDYFLEVGSGSHGQQTAKIMVAFEKVCLEAKPQIVVVVGDVNSTVACALVARKLHIHVAHVESGLRSFDREMPEEINRLATDAISDYLFVTEPSGLENLKKEGKSDDEVFYCGNLMIDTLFFQKKKLGQERSPHAPQSDFGVVTLHRPSNVDNAEKLTEIIKALVEVSQTLPLVFPIHPRTRNHVAQFGLQETIAGGRITLLDPLSYRDFLSLWQDAAAVFTDSGGIQEETTALGIPCFTIRENTERPVTISEGTNTLVGASGKGILDAYQGFRAGQSKSGRVPELWDGQAASRVVDELLRRVDV